MQDGIILVDKPVDMTSFGVVARIRRMLSQQNNVKKMKVGHTGTLDPFATGLMIIVVGKECKNAGMYTKLDKVYESTIFLGKNSTTGDTEGELIDISDIKPSLDDIKKVIKNFIGEIKQTPPIFSAIKIKGERAYDLARSGKTFEMPERIVNIFSLDILEYEYPYLKIRTHVSSGTYIRTLAQDIGEALKTGAYCTELRRTKIADWDIKQAKTLPELGINS